MKQDALKLMIAGPIQPEDEVMEAFGEPVMPHYGSAWTEIYNETAELLKGVFDTLAIVNIDFG